MRQEYLKAFQDSYWTNFYVGRYANSDARNSFNKKDTTKGMLSLRDVYFPVMGHGFAHGNYMTQELIKTTVDFANKQKLSP